jgi:hypothetical protein
MLRLYFKGQKSLEPPRKIIKCWWCVILRDIALALGVRPEEHGKGRDLYIIYQIAYVGIIQTSSRGLFISRKKGSVV